MMEYDKEHKKYPKHEKYPEHGMVDEALGSIGEMLDKVSMDGAGKHGGEMKITIVKGKKPMEYNDDYDMGGEKMSEFKKRAMKYSK